MLSCSQNIFLMQVRLINFLLDIFFRGKTDGGEKVLKIMDITLGLKPILIFLASGFGAKSRCHVNDSYFEYIQYIPSV